MLNAKSLLLLWDFIGVILCAFRIIMILIWQQILIAKYMNKIWQFSPGTCM